MDLNELKILFREETVQKREEGCAVDCFANLPLDSFGAASIQALYGDLNALEPREDFPYNEPSSLEEIRAQRPQGPRRFDSSLSPEQLQDRLAGAWLGRSAGCLLGKPVEGWPRHHIEALLAKAGRTGLDDYFPEVEYTEGPFPYLPIVRPWLAGNITSMACDDDMDYTMLGLLVLEEHGRAFTTENIAAQWLSRLPYSRVFTAEYIAYRNFCNGLKPPQTALHMNPYREWIGAQIRADIWGYVNPAAPEQAAEYAHRDARLSHCKNGMYGEMFVAATLAAVLGGQDIPQAIATGLSEIPARSRLAEAVKQVAGWCESTRDWQAVWALVEERFGAYNRVHTINNAAYVALALLLAEDDFEKAVTVSVACGLDTDCNGATVGSIIGARLGAAALPGKWIAPLRDTIQSDLVGLSTLRLSDLARRTFALATQA